VGTTQRRRGSRNDIVSSKVRVCKTGRLGHLQYRIQVWFVLRARYFSDAASAIPNLDCRKLGMLRQDELASHLHGRGITLCFQIETGYMPGPKPMAFLYEGCARPR
jgi:hypothetical protein